MGDRLRTIACYGFVGMLLGGLWFYADLQRRINAGSVYHFEPTRTTSLPTTVPSDPAISRADSSFVGE